MISTASVKKRLYLVVARYFKIWANLVLIRWKPRVIAVTGSVGKTTMLNLLEVQLGRECHYSHNANSAYGIAFDLLGLSGVGGSKLRWIWLFVAAPVKSFLVTHHEEFYVVEIDGERPHETEYLASWLKPEITIWISLGRSHASYYDGQVARGEFASVEEAIAHEFGALPRHTSKLVIYDPSNELLAGQIEPLNIQKLPISASILKEYDVWPERSEFVLPSGKYSFEYPLPRETWLQLAMLEELTKYLGREPKHDMGVFVLPPGRSSFFAGVKNTKLIDSTYNAHLISVQSIASMLREMHADKKWLVIGDIVEQGVGEAEEHRRLGEVLAEIDAERYVLVGKRTRAHTLPVLENLGKPVESFLHVGEAIDYLDRSIQGGETILCKGSQYLEAVIEHLLADPQDVSRLPRREKSAVRRRARWGVKV